MADSAPGPTQPEVNNNASNLEAAAKHGPLDDAVAADSAEGPPPKRARLEDDSAQPDERELGRRRGIAPVKAEYALRPPLL